MSDFNQWRFKMHGTKSWIPPTAEVDDKPRFNEKIFASSSTNGTSATLPRRKPRPKLMSYFGGHNHQSAESEHFLLSPRPALNQAAGNSTNTLGTASEVDKETTAAAETLPDVELSITALMSRLLSDPGKGLSLQDTSLVLRIVESHRELSDKVTLLEEELITEKERTKLAAEELQQVEVIRASDEKDFRSEIKRLEMVIAEGKRGMSDLLKARQGSLIRRSNFSREVSSDDGFGREREAEIPQAHLGKTEKAIQRWYGSPTKTIRLIPQSPSWKMAKLSKQFSTSNLQHEDSFRMHLREYESYTEPKISSNFLSTDINVQQFTDAENSSVSSCGDSLLDEFQRTPEAGKSLAREEEKTTWQMANILASRRGINVADIMPALMQLFQGQPSLSVNVFNDVAINGQKTSVSSGLLAKSKVETKEKSRGGHNTDSLANCDSIKFGEVFPVAKERRFSFCPNDDDAIKLRDSWNKRKPAIERGNDERPMSSSTGIALASSKPRNPESCPNCSPRSLLSISQLSRRSGNQNFAQIRSPSGNRLTTAMSTAATPDKEWSGSSKGDSHLLDLRMAKEVEKTYESDLHTKLHPFARFPSSGSHHSVVTAIWQDANPDSNDHELGANHHHCQHARSDSAISSLSRRSQTHKQSLAMASLDMTEPNSVL